MTQTLRVDIVSDVVCPWCIVGYRQLEDAAAAAGAALDVHWHPFELNPNMPAEGQNLRAHIMEKYGSSATESDNARKQLTDIGAGLGFTFNFEDDSRMVNTFQAHQLLHWASEQGREHDLKMALFTAHFTDGADISDVETLLDVAASIGLYRAAGQAALSNSDVAKAVREKQRFWQQQGISGVPAMVFNRRHLVTGAQGAENYTNILTQLAQMEPDPA